MKTCSLCQKHNDQGEFALPPGGYIYEDKHFKVCHAPVDKGPLGTLFIESRRHVLDFSEFNEEEAADFGEIARKIYAALRPLVGAERIYQVSMMEGVPHFHAWLIPRTKDISEHAIAFLARDDSCTQEAAVQLASELRDVLETGQIPAKPTTTNE